jgi:simple sugar transport system ATP-binding protein
VKWLDHKFMREVVFQELTLMGLKRKLDPNDNVSKLSGGERQAIAIARARFFGAKLLILDEPTSALSVGQTQAVLDYIKEAAEAGIAVIFITHTLHHIERIVDKVVILHRGSSVGHFEIGDIDLKQCANLIMHGQISSATS